MLLLFQPNLQSGPVSISVSDSAAGDDSAAIAKPPAQAAYTGYSSAPWFPQAPARSASDEADVALGFATAKVAAMMGRIDIAIGASSARIEKLDPDLELLSLALSL